MKLEGLGLKNLLDLLIDNSEHKGKVANKNVVATVSHNEYKDVFLNNKYKTLDEQNPK